jgi:hypothetical protein
VNLRQPLNGGGLSPLDVMTRETSRAPDLESALNVDVPIPIDPGVFVEPHLEILFDPGVSLERARLHPKTSPVDESALARRTGGVNSAEPKKSLFIPPPGVLPVAKGAGMNPNSGVESAVAPDAERTEVRRAVLALVSAEDAETD